jgi:hypothetical protein
LICISNSVMKMISRRLMGQCTSLYANSCSTIFVFFSIVCLQLKCNYRFIRTFSRVYPTFDKEVLHARRVWRYQRGNQNSYIEEEKWPKEKGQKDKQRSTKHTHKIKDQVARTPLKAGDELRCSGRVSNIGQNAIFCV